MKLSKMRAKARSKFRRDMALYRWPDGSIFWEPAKPEAGEGVSVEVVFIRGREFTKPQAAWQGKRRK